MNGWRTLCNTVYWFALTAWCGALMSAAVAAAATFATLPGLGVFIGRFSAYDGMQHGRIAAGHVMEPIFTFVDLVQLASCAVVLAAIVLQWLVFRHSLRNVFNVVRVASLVIAGGLFAYRAAALTPDMNRELRAYWQAAEAGEVDRAEAHRAAFDESHPVASDLYAATLGLVIIGVLASPAALLPPRGTGAARMETPRPGRAP